MSPEEYNSMKEEAQTGVPANIDTSARDFIMGRTKEIIDVPIEGPDGSSMDIRIRARLSKREVKEHKNFLNLFKDPDSISEDDADKGASKFLAAITLDKSLDEDFWNSDELDPYIVQELLTAFMVKAAESLEGVKKFRKK